MTDETSNEHGEPEKRGRVPFWKARSSLGRRPIFEDPEQLWSACLEYFQWIEENPLIAIELVKFQGAAKQAEVPKMRPMTLGGLYIFLDITRQTWTEYRENKGIEFSTVANAVEEIIRTQKFEGAAADLLNANIIARDLGLADRQEHSGKDGGPIETKELSDNDYARRTAFLLQRARRQGAGAAQKADPSEDG